MISDEALTTVNVSVITKLYIYLEYKGRQRPAFNYLELNQLLRYGNGPFDLFIR